MQDGSGRIVVRGLTKNFGHVAAVQNLSFQVEPGSVTGFLGPNGAGKTTTLRMLLGLVNPSSGEATINGQPFHRLGNPGRVVGAVLEAQGFHPKRTAINHLRVYTAAMGLPDQRAMEVLMLVGLGGAANRKAGGFSLGMKQRLALATALLGDPQVLVLDEPANGLDPEGIAWLRTFLKSFAATGRTVLISSHLLAEVEQTIDQVVIVSRGQTVYYGGLDDLRRSQQSRVLVQPADAQALAAALQEAGHTSVTLLPDGRLAVVDATVQQVGDIASKAGIALYGVQEEQADLEQLFFRLTSGQWSAQGYAPPGFDSGQQVSGFGAPQAAPQAPQYGGYPQQQVPQQQAPQYGGYQAAPQFQQPSPYQQQAGYPQQTGGFQQPGVPGATGVPGAPGVVGAPGVPQQGYPQQAPVDPYQAQYQQQSPYQAPQPTSPYQPPAVPAPTAPVEQPPSALSEEQPTQATTPEVKPVEVAPAPPPPGVPDPTTPDAPGSDTPASDTPNSEAPGQGSTGEGGKV
ncbi:ABC-2 type transport system ATP-binding protein [Actinokineospora cianjurensis]|uniref:ABC-2 type transport system ATP-binding protein n=1 Tax=Actinokineospora cianjurensis TaxID=585224 RepID=A0A421B9T9_9PSEU|nr:ABC-2 type transport system ATP-binding protein [Actinokineospora cianjurensis]